MTGACGKAWNAGRDAGVVAGLHNRKAKHRGEGYENCAASHSLAPSSGLFSVRLKIQTKGKSASHWAILRRQIPLHSTRKIQPKTMNIRKIPMKSGRGRKAFAWSILTLTALCGTTSLKANLIPANAGLESSSVVVASPLLAWPTTTTWARGASGMTPYTATLALVPRV